MATYSTKLDLVNNLSRQFNRTVDATDVKIRLHQNTPTSIKINGTTIRQYDGVWHYKDKVFHYKKSAVGYAISMINNDHLRAKQIRDLDMQISKLTEDILTYRYHMRHATKVRKNILSCRISDDSARLDLAKHTLYTNLLSINLT